MPWHGYLQDLSQLIEPPLLDINETELIDSSLEEPKTSCFADLTTSTLAAMLMLNEAAQSNDKADGKATSINPQFTDGSDKENVSLTSTSTTLTASSPISKSPLVHNRRVEEGNLLALDLRSRGDPLKAIANGTVQPPSVSSHDHGQQLVNTSSRILTTPYIGPQEQPFTPSTNGTAQAPSSSTISHPSSPRHDKVAIPSQARSNFTLVPSSHFQLSKKSVQHQSSSVMAALVPTDKSFTSDTALATRTTEVVIEDLIADRKRHGNDSLVNSSKRRQASYASEGALSTSTISDLPEVQFNSDLNGHVGKGKGSSGSTEDDEDYYDEDEEEGGLQPVPGPRKLTQRRIRLNAIADNYMHDLNQKLAKGGNKVRPEDEAVQSARWLVNQSENRQIISSPREYQVELFEKAKEKNIIAVLDTGSGKTLIAVLLLRHIFAQELEDRAIGKPKRISFFLVDSVQLVFQQHAVLKANLDQPMDLFCGDMGVDLWNKKKWQGHLSKNMVIVCTAEVLRQCLHHSFVTMEQINLLIFDEAHHAKKDHSYARIIKDFYAQQGPDELRPKIFGMTASPVDARVDVRKAAAELEALLHCQISTAADSSLLQYTVTSKQELLVKYAPLGPRFETPLYAQMREKFKSNLVLKKPLIFSYESTRMLGAWCADKVWEFCMEGEEVKKLLAKTERKYHATKVQGPLEILEKQKAQIIEAQAYVKSVTFDPPHFEPSSSTSSNLSTKVVELIKILKDRFQRPTEDKVIVFVQQRYTARILAKLFQHPDIGTKHLHVGTLVGTRSGEAGDLNVSFREQVVTMMNFRKGIINVMFATSVAEEGLDIPDCNLVVRFDLYATLIQYIQSRGRARHNNSRFIHMCEDGNQEHHMIIREVRKNENILKRFCEALPEDRKLTGNDFDMDHFLAKERTHRVKTTPAGAKLNYKVSLMVLANFVDSLPQGPDIHLQPEYIMTTQNKQFLCETILPESSPIRSAVGRPATTKQVAKCSAAFETCLSLWKGKYLDDNLLPTFTKQLPVMRNALLAVDSKKREAYDMKTKPAMWSVGGIPDVLFVTVLSLATPEALGRISQPLALLTRDPFPQLPSFELHFGGGRHSPVQCTPIIQPIEVSATTLDMINTFTLCLFDHVFSKQYESDTSKMPYFLIPVCIGVAVNRNADPLTVISWDVLQSVQDHQLKWADNPWGNKFWQTESDDFFADKYIIDPFDGSRKLWSKGVTREYNALDPVPLNTAPRVGARKDNSNILEYSCSLWAKARSRRVFDPTQRVVEAEYISLRRNLLDEFDEPVDASPKKCFVVLEPLQISPLPTTVVAMAYVFPAIIHRVESYLIALEACAMLRLDVRPDLALEAVTKDSDNSGEHGLEQINFQRGMGKNYERLEFLGDCFLKMATSIALFGIHPDNDEFKYHVDRMLLICNKNLKNNAVKLRLYEFIRSQSFNRRAWYPEGLVLKKGKTATAPKTQKLGEKSIADVCEALIGAALLNSHGTGNMDNAVRAVTELVSSENHRVTSFSEYYKLYSKPKYQTAASTEMQRDLAKQLEQKHPYHFRYPRLVRSAFVHPSYPFSYEKVPSYQRLEFLGDALLDMACVNFLFHNFQDKDPQWLTEHKMAMVSNRFLGALCVKLSFHKHLLLFNSTFQKQIEDYVTDITEAQTQAEEDAIRAGKSAKDCAPDYWTTVRQPPKCLPDIVEAYIGAIFVDSEYNYSLVEQFFDMHIKWYFKDMTIYDTYANKHPTTFLTNFLQVNMGCVDFATPSKQLPSIDGSKPTCVTMVIIHDKVIVDAQAESTRYASVAAARKAIALLQGLPLSEFREKYGCNCRPEEVEEELKENGQLTGYGQLRENGELMESLLAAQVSPSFSG